MARRIRSAAAVALLPVALAVGGCATDSGGERFRLAGSVTDALIPGAGSGPETCIEYHRSLRGRSPEEARAQLARAYGVRVDAQQAARHVDALDQLCAPMPSGN